MTVRAARLALLLLPAVAGAQGVWRAGATLGAEYSPAVVLNRSDVAAIAPSVTADFFRSLHEAWEVGITGSFTHRQGNGAAPCRFGCEPLAWVDAWRIGGAVRFSSPLVEDHRVFVQLAFQYAPSILHWSINGSASQTSTTTYHAVAGSLTVGALFVLLPWLRLRAGVEAFLEGYFNFSMLGAAVWAGADAVF
jgi:hypothetical protein